MKSLVRLISAGLIAATVFAPGSSFAEQSKSDDGERKINLSGRQRMLSQFMAKAACFASIYVRREHHLNQMAQTYFLFDTTLHGLRHGSETQGMLPESDPTVLEALGLVEREWYRYGAVVNNWATGALRDKNTLQLIYELNLPTLKKMNDTVKLFEQSYSGGGLVDPGIAVALNVSGRQRMLTQKASKEFCMIGSGYRIRENKDNIIATIDLFARSLDDLINGNAEIGVPPAPNKAILDQLTYVKSLWLPFRKALSTAEGDLLPGNDDLKLIAETNEKLLIEMNKAVWLYEEVISGSP